MTTTTTTMAVPTTVTTAPTTVSLEELSAAAERERKLKEALEKLEAQCELQQQQHHAALQRKEQQQQQQQRWESKAKEEGEKLRKMSREKEERKKNEEVLIARCQELEAEAQQLKRVIQVKDEEAKVIQQVTLGHDIVADGWAGVSNYYSYPRPHSIHKRTKKESKTLICPLFYSITTDRRTD